MTLDKLFESLKLKIMTHEKKASAPVAESVDTIQCMTVHKAKGLEFDTVFLFAGNPADGGGNGNQCKISRNNDRFIIDFKLSMKHMHDYIIINRDRVYDEQIASSGFSTTDQNEEWRVLYVALTRAKQNLFVSYIDRNDGIRNPWNNVLQQINNDREE